MVVNARKGKVYFLEWVDLCEFFFWYFIKIVKKNVLNIKLFNLFEVKYKDFDERWMVRDIY